MLRIRVSASAAVRDADLAVYIFPTMYNPAQTDSPPPPVLAAGLEDPQNKLRPLRHRPADKVSSPGKPDTTAGGSAAEWCRHTEVHVHVEGVRPAADYDLSVARANAKHLQALVDQRHRTSGGGGRW